MDHKDLESFALSADSQLETPATSGTWRTHRPLLYSSMAPSGPEKCVRIKRNFEPSKDANSDSLSTELLPELWDRMTLGTKGQFILRATALMSSKIPYSCNMALLAVLCT